MSDRRLARLGSWPCLAALTVLAAAGCAAAAVWQSPWFLAVSTSAAALFGVGGAARDLGIVRDAKGSKQ